VFNERVTLDLDWGFVVRQALDWKAKAALFAHSARVDLSNFHLAHYRSVDAFLVTGKNSGTHWLKCMLSHAMARKFGLPAPARTSGREAEDFISHPRWPQKHPQLPRIASSHNIPSALLGAPLIRRALRLPPVVVLVRDIRDAMLSHYVKWGAAKGLTLSEYVRLPPPGGRNIADVWWYLDFFNRWGQAAYENPGEVSILRYEDLLADPGRWLRWTGEQLGLELNDEAIGAALAASDREFLRHRLDPGYGEEIVPDAAVRAAAAFDPEDRRYLEALLSERLRFSFGYGQARAAAPELVRVARASLSLVA
jgi:hypothetical protein